MNRYRESLDRGRSYGRWEDERGRGSYGDRDYNRGGDPGNDPQWGYRYGYPVRVQDYGDEGYGARYERGGGYYPNRRDDEYYRGRYEGERYFDESQHPRDERGRFAGPDDYGRIGSEGRSNYGGRYERYGRVGIPEDMGRDYSDSSRYRSNYFGEHPRDERGRFSTDERSGHGNWGREDYRSRGQYTSGRDFNERQYPRDEGGRFIPRDRRR